jgi:hypothetical protein
MKERIKELFDEYQSSDMNFFELEKRVLNLFIVSESEFENKLYAKCLDGMPYMTIDEFNDALTDWVQKEVKRKQIEDFDTHSR